MSGFEIKEIKSPVQKEVVNKTKAFENELRETKEVHHIKTINEDLEGRTYPGTNVAYEKHTFRLGGEKVEGVFPVFDSKFDAYLPKKMWNASDSEQFKYCVRQLKMRIENDSDFARKFTPRQLEQIREEAPRISGLTWHHYEMPGRMQLVDSDLHQKCRHTGGRNVWGGGRESR